MRQRRDLKAYLNDGFSATVSPRALASLLPIAASLAHDGISPHFILWRCLRSSISALMVHIRDEGAMFQEGDKSTSPDSRKCSANLLGFSFSANLPHISINPVLKLVVFVTRYILLPSLYPICRHRVLCFRQ